MDFYVGKQQQKKDSKPSLAVLKQEITRTARIVRSRRRDRRKNTLDRRRTPEEGVIFAPSSGVERRLRLERRQNPDHVAARRKRQYEEKLRRAKEKQYIAIV